MRATPLLMLAIIGLAACRAEPPQEPRAAAAFADGSLADPVIAHLDEHGVALLSSLAPNGLRVTIAPSLGDYVFVVDFVPSPIGCAAGPAAHATDIARPGPERCIMAEVHYAVIGGESAARGTRRYRFAVPWEEVNSLRSALELRARHTRGRQADVDGTRVGVEEYRAGRLRSLSGNSFDPGDAAAELRIAVHRLLLAYGPTGAVPISDSFTVNDTATDPCFPSGFNLPDPDGYGTGDDACGRHRAAPPAAPAR